MSWLAVFWAVITGVAAGISADWDGFVARHYSGKKEEAQADRAQAQAEANKAASTNPAAPTNAQINVDVPKREGEFSSGVPFAGGPRFSSETSSQAAHEGESRRKRRNRPAPTPAEKVCARCKAAIEHDLSPVNPADLAVAIEAETESTPAPAESTPSKAQEPIETPPTEKRGPASDLKAPRNRGPITDRVATSLSTRGALTRLVGPATANQAKGG